MLLPNQIYTWIEHIILSCTSDFQFECVNKLIELFIHRFPEEESLSSSLKQLCKKCKETIKQKKVNMIQ